MIDVDLGRADGTHDAKPDHFLTIETGPAALLGPFVHDLAEVAQSDGAATDRDQCVPQSLDGQGRADRAYGLFLATDLAPAAGQVGIRRPQLL